MKRLILIIALSSAMYSCTKSTTSSLEEDNGCIERLKIPVTSHGTLSDSDYTLINSLFLSNRIDSRNYRYTRTYRDSVRTYNGTYDFRNVYIIQYANNLPIFVESLNYLFSNGIFSSYSGKITSGTNLNTTATLRLGQLRKLFIRDIELFDHKGNQFKDSCFNAEFGYFNLNMSTGNPGETLVKAWRVTPKSSSYPEAYYRDLDGQRIYYFNGIEMFK